MSSKKQVEANRRNALKSTGPRSDEGKAVVKLNALKHGLRSDTQILPGEDSNEYERLVAEVAIDLQANGAMETLLVQRIVSLIWRLDRLSRVEMGLFARQYYQQIIDYERAKVDDDPVLLRDGNATIYSNQALREQRLRRALGAITDPVAKERVEEAQLQVDSEVSNLGAVFQRDAEGVNTFAKLSRYEINIERSLHKTMEELQRLQEGRRSRAVPASMKIQKPSESQLTESQLTARQNFSLPLQESQPLSLPPGEASELSPISASMPQSEEMALFGKKATL